MFWFFKKKKEKFGPEFDKKLIQKFHKDHKKLLNQVSKIETAYSKNNEKTTKKELQTLKYIIVEHFRKEDIKLYWYLKILYKDDVQILQEIKYFENSIKGIHITVINFLDHYTKQDVFLNTTFKNEFDEIVRSLGNRMKTEEKNLYSLYKKICN